PFFIEELVRALFDQQYLTGNGEVKLARPISQAQLPVTVQGVISSRIDRLPPEHKQLLQTLAVIGRKFSVALVEKVAAVGNGNEIGLMLSALQGADFIRSDPGFRELAYTFKHALTQEVAYSSILTDRRRMLHECTGDSIEALYSNRLEDHLGELA